LNHSLNKCLVRARLKRYYAPVNRDRNLIALAVVSLLLSTALAPEKVFARTVALPSVFQDPAPLAEAERSMFTQGQNLFLQGSYTRSAEVLEKFLTTYPRSILTDLTLLWLGRSYLQLGKFAEAEDVGKRLHTITDTPFAEIYDTELRAALRDSAKQTDANVIVEVNKTPAAQVSSPPAATSRSRFAKPPAPASNPPASSGTNNRTNRTRQSVAKTEPGKKGNQLNGGRRPAGKPGQTTKTTASAKIKAPATVRRVAPKPSGKAQAATTANSLKRPQSKSSAPGRSRSTLAANTAARLGGKNVVKPKPAASLRTSTAAKTSSQRKGNLTAARPQPRVTSSTTAPRKQVNPTRSASASGNQNSAGVKSRSNTDRGVERGDSMGATLPLASNIAGQQTVNVSTHATGGLYSMMDAAPAPMPASNAAATAPVKPVVSDARVDAKSKGMNAKPGETIYLSFVVRNYGSTRQTYELRISAPGAPEAQLFVDSNGDGLHQSDELRVTGSPVVELKNSEVPFLLQVNIPRTAVEGQQYSYTVTVLSFGTGEVVARTTSTLTISSIRASAPELSIPERSRTSLAN
jgi:hypothetical protein